jgi:hypothetical protein
MDWVKFDAELARDGAVDPVDKALYAALASFVPASSSQQRATEADGADVPTRRVLAACIGRSVDTVDRATKRLEERGLIAVERRRDPDNPRSNLPSVYRLLDHERWDERAAERVEARRKARQKPLAASVRPPSPQPCDQVAAPVRPGGSRTDAAVPLPSEKSSLEKSSLPSVPAQRAAGPAPAEREIVTPIDRPSTAQQVVRAASILTSGDDETAFITWATARYRIRSGALWRTVAANGDLVDWVAAWRAEGSQAVAHGLTGTDAAVSGWYALADQLRQEGTTSTTDQRVQAALDLGRQMQAEADARRGGYQPYRDACADARRYTDQQAAVGARPYGWEQVPHCGHLDCDEITRYRETEDADGLRSLSACPDCHPSLRF